ncbi:MAG: efflux RND transporter periplasmic adaptor subunit [Gammaproteobacteria bacterium]|nr:efflux RND transporter periplasmic adaptor subunit [Gammaproteobacteria bacterium]
MKIFYRWTLSCLIGLSWIQTGQADREVSVERFADIAFAKTLQYPASIINLQVTDIAAEASGRIIYFPALVGDEVIKDQVIIKLDCTSALINKTRIEAGIKQLKAKRQLTRQQLKRAKRLSRTNSISKEELDQRETQLEADNASIEEQQALLEAASQSVEYCQIKVPFDGMIIAKNTSIGSYATPGAPQFKLLKLDAVEVRLEIPLGRARQLKQAKSIIYQSESIIYPLKIRKVLPVVDSSSNQQLVHLTITASTVPPGGSFGLVNFDTKKHFIAAKYIQKRDGQFGVFIADQGRAKFKVLPNAQEGQSVSGKLPPDTLIISNQLQLLTDDEKITLRP